MFNVFEVEEQHLFNKIKKNSFLLSEIFNFLNLSNAKVLLHVNKRFRDYLLKNDSYHMRSVGNYTYGLSKNLNLILTVYFKIRPTKRFQQRHAR
jgi:hypothetical protein